LPDGLYQVLKTKPAVAVRLLYVALKGPFGDARMEPTTYENEFTADALEGVYRDLPITSAADVNRLISGKTINFRLILIQIQK